MKKVFLSTALFMSLVCNNNVIAWDNDITHRDISRAASENSVLSKNKGDYLMNLGFDGGLKEEFRLDGVNKIVSKWMEQGAFDEDAGSTWDAVTGKARYVNHFHNPTKPWDNAGLSDLQNGESSARWAQDSEKQKVALGGDWSWKRVRECFYAALTGKNFAEELIAPNDWQKEEFFARTFKGLGYQIHLVQDASQPAHVRNDAHPMDGKGWVEGLETWAKFHSVDVNSFASAPKSPQLPLNVSVDQLAPAPITQFIDTRQYIANTLPSTSLAWGLSEYTNSNFVSDDTIFTEFLTPAFKHYFPYPRYSSQCYEMFEETDSSTNKKTKYFRKKCDGEQVNHFVTVGPLHKYLPQWLQNSQLKLTSAVHRDYAEKLIPRAVGYSAGLLNYFFRGSLEVTPPDQYVYSVIDGSQTYPLTSTYWDANGVLQQVTTEHQQFTKIKAKIRNTTPNEEQAGEGTLMAVAEYSIIPDYEPDLSNYPPSAQNVYKNSLDYVPYSYSVSKPIPISSLSSSQATEFTFDFTDQPIPVGIVDFSLHFVFKGTLGGEKDAAIAVARKAFSEPVHQTFWNLTDMYSLEYQLFTSDYIKSNNNMKYLVDLDKDGIFNETAENEPYIDPYPMSFEIGYSGTNPPATPIVPSATVTNLYPGRYIRLIALVDEWTNYVSLKVTDPINPEPKTYIGTFSAVDYTSTPENVFRDVDEHYNLGIVRCSPMATYPSGAKYCVYNDSEAITPPDLTPVQAEITY